MQARYNRFQAILALLITAICFSACNTVYEEGRVQLSETAFKSIQRYKKAYTLGPGDVIEVLILKNPEMSRQNIFVKSDGFISLPLLGEVKADGKTFEQLKSELIEGYSKRLNNPEVNILAQSVKPPSILVMGEVGSQTIVPYNNSMTAAEALAQVGGLRITGKKNAIALIRLNDDGYLEAKLIEPAFRGPSGIFAALQKTYLKPDDILVIPETTRSKFKRFVQDFVTQPMTAANSVMGFRTSFLTIKTTKENLDSIEQNQEIQRIQLQQAQQSDPNNVFNVNPIDTGGN